MISEVGWCDDGGSGAHLCFHDDLGAGGGGHIEGNQHEVQVARETIHARHFAESRVICK